MNMNKEDALNALITNSTLVSDLQSLKAGRGGPGFLSIYIVPDGSLHALAEGYWHADLLNVVCPERDDWKEGRDFMGEQEWVRIHFSSDEICVETYHRMNADQLETLMNLFEAHPQHSASYDYGRVGMKEVLLKNVCSPAELIEAFYKFYGEAVAA